MGRDGVLPDDYTMATIFKLSGELKDLASGKLIHGKGIRIGFVSDVVVANSLMAMYCRYVHMGSSLIDMYCRSKKVVIGRRVFDQMENRNVYVWTAMINGYVQNGAPEDALVLLREMQMKDGIRPNKVSLVSVLPACGLLAGLIGGKQVHGFSIKMELNGDVSLCNALIDMYSKCGSLDYARRAFETGSYFKDAVTWSSMISAYGLHGKGEEAVITYYQMLQHGFKPDMITVVGVLSACSKSGLVDEGISIYKSLMTEYEIKPTVEICACVVDMLSRSGQLDQALEFIKEMPLDPGPSVWGSLLTASVMHGNSRTRDLAYRHLLELEPENPSNYISLSNTYASDRRWDVVTEVRTMMKERGLRKVPGCSWITISGKTHSFSVADKAHPSSSLIYEMLDDLVSIMTDGCGDIDILT
uniref:Uncharacterized protein n=1 Tax=Cajanus cajan TaxID=3821 RepID=A0A151T114_CAJCA|nr:hypothetical protein KK1_023165 [Cajanus cajan]